MMTACAAAYRATVVIAKNLYKIPQCRKTAQKIVQNLHKPSENLS